MLCDGRPILFEQGDLGFKSSVIRRGSRRRTCATLSRWIKGAAGPAATQQVTKFTKAVIQAMKENGVAKQARTTSSTST
jgi:hypothetical protein